MVFCYQNCSHLTVRKNCSRDREMLSRKFFRSLEQFIQTVKGHNNFWEQYAFLTYSWNFLRPNKLEQLRCQSEKKIGI